MEGRAREMGGGGSRSGADGALLAAEEPGMLALAFGSRHCFKNYYKDIQLIYKKIKNN